MEDIAPRPGELVGEGQSSIDDSSISPRLTTQSPKTPFSNQVDPRYRAVLTSVRSSTTADTARRGASIQSVVVTPPALYARAEGADVISGAGGSPPPPAPKIHWITQVPAFGLSRTPGRR